jgi:hypothetical protein
MDQALDELNAIPEVYTVANFQIGLQRVRSAAACLAEVTSCGELRPERMASERMWLANKLAQELARLSRTTDMLVQIAQVPVPTKRGAR